LYPFEFRFEGWFDAWAWSVSEAIMWATIPFVLWRIAAYTRVPSIDVLAWPSEQEVA